jgi:hypothetical protein
VAGLVVVNLVSTCFMAGLIWFVQLVHYPLLGLVPVADSPAVAAEHQRRTGLVVAAPMAAEGLTTLWLMFDRPSDVPWWLAWAGGVCVAIWLVSTVALSVPRHRRMLEAPDDRLGRSLVLTNWPRTIAWSAHAAVAAAIVLRSR